MVQINHDDKRVLCFTSSELSVMRNLNVHLSWDDYNEGVIHGSDWALSDALAPTAVVPRLAGKLYD